MHTEKLRVHDIGARLQHTLRKSLKHLAQESGVSKSSARMTNSCWSHPVKVDVWCAVSAGSNVVPVFLTKQLIAKNTYM
jgi:hypothetical protein